MRTIVLVLVLGFLIASPALADPATRPAHDPLSDLPSYGDALRRMIITLLAIIAGLIVLARFLPRFLGKHPDTAPGKMIHVVESRVLAPGKTLYLVNIAGQFYLLGSSGDRLEVLAGAPLDSARLAVSIEQSPPPAAPPPKGLSFADFLKK